MKGRKFNRKMTDDLVHFMGIQMGAFDPRGTTHITELRANLHHMFAMNLGIYVPDILIVTDSIRKAGACYIRNRLGALIDEGKEVCDMHEQALM